MNKADHFPERIEYLLNKLGGPSEFARQTGVTLSTIARWRKGEAEPSRPNLVKISEVAGVSVEWLATGKEEQEKEKTVYQPFENKRLYNEQEDDDFEEIDDFRDVIVTAGFGGENDDYIEPATTKVERAWLQTRRLKAKDCAMFSVSGDSMEPTLKDGDEIIVDRSKTQLREGNIFVLNNNGLMLVKRIQATFNGITLLSDNKDYDPIELETDDADRLQVIGQVVRGYKDF